MSYGFWHLKKGNKDDAFGSYAGGRSWQDFADWTISWVLRDPAYVYYSYPSQKWCYERPFQFYQGKNLIRTKYVSVVMGKTARRIITAYTNDGGRCRGNRVL